MSLFCDVVYFSTYLCTFHCILPVPTPQYTIILLLLPNILFICCCYTYTEHLPSRYVKIIHWNFLVYWISTIFLPIFGIFQCIPPVFTLMYAVKLILNTLTYHAEHVITWIASDNVLFCMSYYCWAKQVKLTESYSRQTTRNFQKSSKIGLRWTSADNKEAVETWEQSSHF